jgi:beta-ureidopropionase / N-carbamoyl-L-amino-acid hydrolase
LTSAPSEQPQLRALADNLFATLREASFDGVGVTRASYGESETRAFHIVAEVAEKDGLDVAYDRAGNLVITLEGEQSEQPFVACGSHLDSVPEGGNFDGAAGVIAGLLVLISLRRAGFVPATSLKVYALRAEESAWFGQAYLGSRALFGALASEDLALAHRDSGQPLEQYMVAAGADVEAMRAGEPLLKATEVACYFELHIEQGPVMVAREIVVGVVTGIRGNHRHAHVTCTGEAAHSGAVPRWLRHDAVFAISEFIMRLDRHWQALLEQGQDLVVTVGILGTNPAEHAMSRVPGHVECSVEYRSESRELLEDFEELARMEAAGIERLRGVKFDVGESHSTAPATMSAPLVNMLDDICGKHGIAHERIPSGAGHDAAVFANHGVPSAMIFIRNENGSHNPYEQMDMDDFWAGVDVLKDAMLGAPEVLK